jgi:glycosyltransferase involved in cell wall biosynthesis
MEVLPYFLPGTMPETVDRTTPRPQDRPYFLFVGRLERIKGLDSVIPVFDRYPDVDLLVIGDGDQAEALREQGRNVPNVKFVGRLANEELRRYYEHALALIVPSRGYETFGIVLIEAFRFGTPVIARRIGPFPEIVEQSGGGLLFSNDDELAAAIKRVHGDPEYRARLGRAAFVACRARWSEDVVINRFLEMVAEARALPVTSLTAEPAETASDAPVFTVIVPTHHRPSYLRRCLELLAAQDYARGYEIIVVDDGGSTPTADVVDHFRAAGLAVRYLSQAQSGPAAARNRAARAARGRYLAFTDDDCAPRNDWLTHLERALIENPDALVGGYTINALPAVRYSTASQMLIDYLYEYYHVEQTGARFFTTNNLAMDAGTFRLLGGFDHTFPLAAAEDREFCERWQRSGRRLLYNEAAVVQHWHLLDFRTFVRQHFNYGRGADFLHRSRARDGGSVRIPKLEPPVFYFNLVTAPLRKVLRWESISLAGLMLLTQVAYGAGYGFQRIKRVFGKRDETPSSPTN